MAIGYLLRGTTVEIDQLKYILKFKAPGDIWQLEQIDTGRLSERTETELLELLRAGQLVIVLDTPQHTRTTGAANTSAPPLPAEWTALWNSAPDAERAIARARLRYVERAMQTPLSRKHVAPAVVALATELQDPRTPGCSTVIGWCRAYIRAGRDLAGLLPRTRARGNRTLRVPAEVAAIVDRAIEDTWLTPERPTQKDTLDAAVHAVNQAKRLLPAGDPAYPRPTLRLLRSRIARHRPYDVCAARYGRTYANHKFRNVLGGVDAGAPLERVEIDHTPLDIMVVDDNTGLPLGRVWVTVALDTYSRAVLGYALSFEPPSYLSVMRCLQHALMPKSYLKSRYPAIKHYWFCYGVMLLLVVDHGKEFHSQALEDAARRFGIIIQYCPVKKPWYKAHVERFLGTLNRNIAHGIKGTTFSSLFEKGDYDPEKTSCMTLRALDESLHTWIVDVYHQTVHRTLRDTPANAWERAIAQRPVPLPTQRLDMEAAFGIPDTRTLTHKGIELELLFYNSDECQSLRYRLGNNVVVNIRKLPDELGYIYVEDPATGQPFKVPVIARFRPYATGLSAWQHQVCRRFARLQLNNRADIDALAEAKARIADIVASQLKLKRGNQRRRGARWQHAGPAPVAAQATFAASVVVTAESPQAAPGDATPFSPIEVPASTFTPRFVARRTS